MIDIATCESGMRQFDTDGKPLRGSINPQDEGIFQINRTYHLKEANALGMNLDTLEGNVAFALYLYSKEGTRPWNASKACWGPKEELAFSG